MFLENNLTNGKTQKKFPENFLENRRINLLGVFGKTAAEKETALNESAKRTLSENRAKDTQNALAEEYYHQQLDAKNSAWNPVDIVSRGIRSAFARTTGRPGETLGKRAMTTGISFATLGFAPLIAASMDTLKPNAQGIINRTRGVVGHTVAGTIPWLKLPFSLAGNAIHAGTSALGAAGNLGVAAPQAVLGAAAGIGNIATKPLKWIPGGEWINQKFTNGQNRMFSNTRARLSRTRENIGLVGEDIRDSYKDTKGTVIEGMKHQIQGAAYAVSPHTLYPWSQEPIENSASALKNSHLMQKIYTPTGPEGTPWVQSEKGKAYQSKHRENFPENKYDATANPYPKVPIKNQDYTSNEVPENPEISALQAEVGSMKTMMEELMRRIPEAPTNNPNPPEEQSA